MGLTLPARFTRPGVAGAGRRAAPPAVFVVPLLVAAAVLLPVIYLVVRASGADEGVRTLLLTGRTLRILINTLALTAAVTASAAAVALPLAWLTVRTDLPWAPAWFLLTTLPMVVPSYIGGIIVGTVFGPAGALQALLDRAGVTLRVPSIYGFTGAWITLTLVTYPYLLLSIRAALRGLDPSLEEASRVLGESGWRSWRRVSFPQLRPWIVGGALLVSLYVLSDFGAVSMMQYDSFTTAIYLQYQGSFNRAYAAVLSLVLVGLAACLLVLEATVDSRRARYHRLGTGVARLPRRVALGPWRWPAIAFCALIAALGVLVPIVVLAYWLAVGMRHGEPLALTLGPAINSVYVSTLAAAATVAAGLSVGILSARYDSRAGGLIVRLAYGGYALPGLVLALSLVFFAARYVPLIYQTVWLLVFAYAIHFMPQAVGTLRAALLQVSPSQEEAARTLGSTPSRVMATVTLPLLRPGIVAAVGLIFLSTMKELPATLLLSPIGFETLATRIWSAATEGFFARAAAPALLLLLLSSLSMGMLVKEVEPA